MSVANVLLTFTDSLGVKYYTTTTADGSYTIDLPKGVYTMSVGMEQEDGFVKTFDRAVVTDADQTLAQVGSPLIPDIDIDATVPATVDVYYDKVVYSGILTPTGTTGSVILDRSVDWRAQVTIDPSMFGFTTNEVSPIIETIKIVGIPVAGNLFYNGFVVVNNQELAVIGGTAFEYTLTYAGNEDNFAANDDLFYYTLKTVDSTNFSTNGTFTATSSVMSKVRIYDYLDYTPAVIKTRASIPAQNGMATGSNYVDCYKIDTRSIANVLGESPYATIGDLSSSVNVNEFSYFSPREWWDNSGTIESREKVTVTQDNFAGYNHIALPPRIINHTNEFYPDNPSQSSITAQIYIGEIDWDTAIGAKSVRMSTVSGSYVVYQDKLISQAATGIMSLTTIPNPEFTANQVMYSTFYFTDIDGVVIGTVPELPVLESTYIATTIEMSFDSNDGATEYQSFDVTTPEANWTIVSHPAWITCAVYRGGSLVTSGFVSGDQLRVYPSSVNTSLNRSGLIVLSENVQINVYQEGGVPTCQYTSSTIVTSAEYATLVINGSSIPFTFTVVSGVGPLNAAITIQAYKDGYGWIGNPLTVVTRDGRVVNSNLTGFTPTDIQNGCTYTINVETLV